VRQILREPLVHFLAIGAIVQQEPATPLGEESLEIDYLTK
jgi:hypothetical protein